MQAQLLFWNMIKTRRKSDLTILEVKVCHHKLARKIKSIINWSFDASGIKPAVAIEDDRTTINQFIVILVQSM